MGRSPQYTRSSGNGQYQQQLGQLSSRPVSSSASTATNQPYLPDSSRLEARTFHQSAGGSHPNMAAAVQSSHLNNITSGFPNFSAPVTAYSTPNAQYHSAGSSSSASYVPVASTSGYRYDNVSQQNFSSLQSSSTFPSPNYLPNFPLSMSSLQNLRPQALALSLAGPQASLTMTNQQYGSCQPTFPRRDSAPNSARPVASTSNSQINVPMAANAANGLCVSPKLIMTAPSSIGHSRASSRAQSPTSSPSATDYAAESDPLPHGAGRTGNTSAYASSSTTSSPLISTDASLMLSTNANFDLGWGLPSSTTSTIPIATVSSFSSDRNSQTRLGFPGNYCTSPEAQYNIASSSVWHNQSSARPSQRTFQPENTAYIATPSVASNQSYGSYNGHQFAYPRTSSSYNLPSSSTERTFRFTNYSNGHSLQSTEPAAGLPQLSGGAPPYSGLQDGHSPSSEPLNAAMSHAQPFPVLPSSDSYPSQYASATPAIFYSGHNANPTNGLSSGNPSSTGLMRASSANDSLNRIANMRPRRTATTPGPSLAYAPYPTAGMTGLPPLPETESQRMQYTRSSTMSAHSPFMTPRRAVSAYELHDLSQYGPDNRPYGTKTRLNKQGLIHSSDVENAYPGEWGDAFR
jgi:hypothetical protein